MTVLQSIASALLFALFFSLYRLIGLSEHMALGLALVIVLVPVLSK